MSAHGAPGTLSGVISLGVLLRKTLSLNLHSSEGKLSTALVVHQHILRLLSTQHMNISAPASLLAILSALSNSCPADLYSLMNPLPPFPVGTLYLWLSASQRDVKLLLVSGASQFVVQPCTHSCSALWSPECFDGCYQWAGTPECSPLSLPAPLWTPILLSLVAALSPPGTCGSRTCSPGTRLLKQTLVHI